MNCMNGVEVISNIIKSKRCFEDLKISLKYNSNFKQNIIIRKWVSIKPQNEFRAFIFDNKFVAMSQYNYVIKFAQIIRNKNIFCELIQNFWKTKCENILSKKYDKYIIDFAVMNGNNDDKKEEIIVIELNPYETDTDSLLFDWKSKKDQNILMGKNEFEFRLQNKEFDQDDMWRLLPSHKLLVQTALNLK